MPEDPEPTGPVYTKPAATHSIDELGGDPTAKNVDKPDPDGEAIRAKTTETLSKAGFRFAQNLPTLGHRAGLPGKLRPKEDIEARLAALYVVVSWVLLPEEDLSSESLNGIIASKSLEQFLPDEEKAIISMSRSEASAKHQGIIGWRLENMMTLAWILGFDTTLGVLDGQAGGDPVRKMFSFASKVATGAQETQLRSAIEVQTMEDLFYCTHNAVRAAQTGHADQVPEGFHPLGDGGGIHEKRQALTWALSPGVAWDDTDVST
jgi:hypothetical protein